VIAPQELFDLRTNYVNATAQVEKAQASLEATSREYQRLSALNKEDKNVSDKAVEAAEVTFRSDQTTLRNANQLLALSGLPGRQHWGPVVGGWIEHGSAQLEAVLAGRTRLLQATPSEGTNVPLRLSLKSGQRMIEARLLSQLPRVDPRFQTPSYLYSVPGSSAVVPGMNVIAFAAEGSLERGVVIPNNAVLWWQGRRWIYLETARGVFARREISLTTPLRDGWFMQRGFAPGDRVVVEGAQQLLSEEFRRETENSVKDTD
jgi:multidrug efflux pump subunit AcrA (membrane-fusion protein)